jgi:hypothetical protein
MGDYDQDCWLTHADYQRFAECYYFGGPDYPIDDRHCEMTFDFDGSDTFDLRDFAVFQFAFSRP